MGSVVVLELEHHIHEKYIATVAVLDFHNSIKPQKYYHFSIYIKVMVQSENHLTNFKKHTARFEWHAERISSEDSSSAAICKAISY